MSQLFIEGDQVANINITKVLFEQHILADLVSSKESAVVPRTHGDEEG
jgi:hypothetical protein